MLAKIVFVFLFFVVGFLFLFFTFEDVPLVGFMYFVCTRMPGESYCRQLKSLLLCLCYVF